MSSSSDVSNPPATRRTEARLPRGFADRGPAEIAATHEMQAAIRDTFELYGFEAVETPFIEFTDALGKFLPDQDRPNEGVFSFQDDDDQWLSLRYDLTAPLARYVAENFEKLPKPYRSYRNGYVFRNEKPGPGRFRQFMQFDADTVGTASVAADAEMCMLMADTLERAGIKRGDYVVKVNNRKVLDGILEAAGLLGEDDAAKRLIVLRALDKFDKLGTEGVALLLTTGRMDPSGDFTKGAGLSDTQAHRIMEVLKPFNGDALQALNLMRTAVAGSETGAAGVSELDELRQLVEASSYNDGRIVIDPSVVRGLEYYTGPVFEAELTFEVTGDDGQPMRFGSVAGGGRYDGLVARFRGEPVPATGFSIGVSRLQAALAHLGKVKTAEADGPVVVLVMDKDQIAHYQALVGTLRNEGIRAELYLGSAGMKAQMKYADRRNSCCVIIQGSQEREKGEVQIKDLILGATLASAPDREAYLKAQAEAQFAVPETDMVAAVRKVLARHIR